MQLSELEDNTEQAAASVLSATNYDILSISNEQNLRDYEKELKSIYHSYVELSKNLSARYFDIGSMQQMQSERIRRNSLHHECFEGIKIINYQRNLLGMDECSNIGDISSFSTVSDKTKKDLDNRKNTNTSDVYVGVRHNTHIQQVPNTTSGFNPVTDNLLNLSLAPNPIGRSTPVENQRNYSSKTLLDNERLEGTMLSNPMVKGIISRYERFSETNTSPKLNSLDLNYKNPAVNGINKRNSNDDEHPFEVFENYFHHHPEKSPFKPYEPKRTVSQNLDRTRRVHYDSTTVGRAVSYEEEIGYPPTEIKHCESFKNPSSYDTRKELFNACKGRTQTRSPVSVLLSEDSEDDVYHPSNLTRNPKYIHRPITARSRDNSEDELYHHPGKFKSINSRKSLPRYGTYRERRQDLKKVEPHLHMSYRVENSDDSDENLHWRKKKFHHKRLDKRHSFDLSQDITILEKERTQKDDLKCRSPRNEGQLRHGDTYFRKMELFKPSLPLFTGEPHMYHAWLRLLTNEFEDIELSSVDKIKILMANTSEEPLKLIQGLFYAGANNPDKALENIWRSLNQQFGSNMHVASSIGKKIMEFPSIKYMSQGKEVRELLNLCQLIESYKSECLELTIYDLSTGMREIWSKLPDTLQNRWRAHGNKFERENCGKSPTLAIFILFLEEQSIEMSNPNYEKIRFANKPQTKVLRTDVESHQQEIDNSDTNVPRKNFNCPVHQTDRHLLTECFEFKKLPYIEKRNILIEFRRCFRCVEKHLLKNCPNETKCEKCNGNHIVLMHNDDYRSNYRDSPPPPTDESDTPYQD